jgi:hypothetical protein
LNKTIDRACAFYNAVKQYRVTDQVSLGEEGQGEARRGERESIEGRTGRGVHSEDLLCFKYNDMINAELLVLNDYLIEARGYINTYYERSDVLLFLTVHIASPSPHSISPLLLSFSPPSLIAYFSSPLSSFLFNLCLLVCIESFN